MSLLKPGKDYHAEDAAMLRQFSKETLVECLAFYAKSWSPYLQLRERLFLGIELEKQVSAAEASGLTPAREKRIGEISAKIKRLDKDE